MQTCLEERTLHLLTLKSHTVLVLWFSIFVVSVEIFKSRASWISTINTPPWHLVIWSTRQRFSNFNMQINHLVILLKYRFWLIRSGMGLEIRISNIFSEDTDFFNLWTIFGISRSWKEVTFFLSSSVFSTVLNG